jgi:hypothetical protein
MKEEQIRRLLVEKATQLFGPERTETLRVDLERTAADLAALDEQALSIEDGL